MTQATKNNTITVEINKEFFHASNALGSVGYECVDTTGSNFLGSKYYKKALYEKDGQFFLFRGMDHFNKMVYDIKLKKVELKF